MANRRIITTFAALVGALLLAAPVAAAPAIGCGAPNAKTIHPNWFRAGGYCVFTSDIIFGRDGGTSAPGGGTGGGGATLIDTRIYSYDGGFFNKWQPGETVGLVVNEYSNGQIVFHAPNGTVIKVTQRTPDYPDTNAFPD